MKPSIHALFRSLHYSEHYSDLADRLFHPENYTRNGQVIDQRWQDVWVTTASPGKKVSNESWVYERGTGHLTIYRMCDFGPMVLYKEHGDGGATRLVKDGAEDGTNVDVYESCWGPRPAHLINKIDVSLPLDA